jgi:hypothetical protein
MPQPTRETLLEFMAKLPPPLCRAMAISRADGLKAGRGRHNRLKTIDELLADAQGLSRRTIDRLVWKPDWDGVKIGVASRFIQACGVDIFHKSFRRYFVAKYWDQNLPHLSGTHRDRLKKVLGLE